MCWIGKKSQKKIAENDISVFKIMVHRIDGTLFSLYHTFHYVKEKTYEQKIKPFTLAKDKLNLPRLSDETLEEWVQTWVKYRGEDYIDNDNDINDFVSFVSKVNYTRIERGFHSYAMDVKLENYKGVNLLLVFGKDGNAIEYIKLKNEEIANVICTIPKGTTYYENECGEIVSEKIIVNYIENIFKTDSPYFVDLGTKG